MSYQTNRNRVFGYKAEGTFGTAAGASGATLFRLTKANFNMDKKAIASAEVRPDRLPVMGRHGFRAVNGTAQGEMSLGSFDSLIEALMFDTWSSALSVNLSTFTNVSFAGNTATAASGSFITQGFRVGDVVRGSGTTNAANNNKNKRITALTATVMTVDSAWTTQANDTTGSLQRKKKLIHSAGAANTDRSFTFEDYQADIDSSKVATGCVISQGKFTLTPGNMVMFDMNFTGQDMTTYTGGSAPYFSSPTPTTSPPMVSVDAKLAINGVDVLDLTQFELTIANGNQGTEVIGSRVTPAMFAGGLQATCKIGALRQDMQKLSDYIAETETFVTIMLQENESEPVDFFSINLPAVKWGKLDDSDIGPTGPLEQQIDLMLGYDAALGSQYDPSFVSFITSAP
jgi:hypothetical protein